MDTTFKSNKQKLITNFVFICENTTNLQSLINILVAEEILSLNDLENIRGQETTLDKNLKLYQEIVKKVTKGNFIIFLEALRNTHNRHIADIIEGKCSENDDGEVKLKSKLSEDISQGRKLHRLLSNKWWPEEKFVVNSFVERYNDGELIVKKLKDNLELGKDKKIVITQKTVVCGLGGIGKSTTAKWFANKYCKDYNHIIWIDCEGSVLNTSVRRLAKQLNIDQNLGTNLPPRPIEDIFADIENELLSYKSLFIYDNAEEYTGKFGIKNILPKLQSTQCIITSRNQSWGSVDGYGSIPIYHLDVFTLEEALQFLEQSLSGKNKSTDELLERLAKDLGYLPLALQHAVAAIKSIPKMTVKKYIDKIQEQKELYRFIQLDKLDDYERSIFATFSITLNQLREMQPDGQVAVDILYVCAFFRPDYIPTSIFEADEAMCLINQYSMVGSYRNTDDDDDNSSEEDDDDSEIYVTMHRLLQQVIFLQVNKDDHVIQTLDKAIDALSKCPNPEYHGEAVWDYIEKNMELIQRYSDFPNIVYKLQGYLTTDVQEKFLRSLLSLQNVPNTKNVIDFLAAYASHHSSDEDKLDYLGQVLEKIVDLVNTNTTMDAMTKDYYLLAARYNLVKLLIRLNRAYESAEIFLILCAHVIKNHSGRVWTFKKAEDMIYIKTSLDIPTKTDDTVPFREWEDFPITYEKTPDVLKIGCMVYNRLRNQWEERNSSMDEECTAFVERILSLLPSYNSDWLEKTFRGILYYHKGVYNKSYDSFVEGLEIIKFSTDIGVLKYLRYLYLYRIILRQYIDLIEKANKWNSFEETLLQLNNLVGDCTVTVTDGVEGGIHFTKSFGLIINKMYTKYEKYLNCAIILEKLFSFMNKFQCMEDAQNVWRYNHFMCMADIAELSAECYTKNGEYHSAIEVWRNVCRRLKSIPPTLNVFDEMGNPQKYRFQNRTKLHTFGDALMSAMRDKERYAELKIVEVESDAVKKYFK